MLPMASIVALSSLNLSMKPFYAFPCTNHPDNGDTPIGRFLLRERASQIDGSLKDMSLKDMSPEELWQLFPIRLEEHNPAWAEWYAEEECPV